MCLYAKVVFFSMDNIIYTLHLLLDRIETALCLIMEHLNGASMSDDRLDSCIIRCKRMLEEIGDAETH